MDENPYRSPSVECQPPRKRRTFSDWVGVAAFAWGVSSLAMMAFMLLKVAVAVLLSLLAGAPYMGRLFDRSMTFVSFHAADFRYTGGFRYKAA
jgi:hypothetical protein